MQCTNGQLKTFFHRQRKVDFDHDYYFLYIAKFCKFVTDKNFPANDANSSCSVLLSCVKLVFVCLCVSMCVAAARLILRTVNGVDCRCFTCETWARFTEDLRMILRQFSHLRSSSDNDLIRRTLTTYLKTGFEIKSCNFVRDLAISKISSANSLKTCRKIILGHHSFAMVLRHYLKTNRTTVSANRASDSQNTYDKS